MIKNNQAEHRYEMITEGHVSFASYRLKDSKLYVDHVFVPETLRGRGVAAELMKGVVDDARQNGFEIVPICPYAVSYLKRHA